MWAGTPDSPWVIGAPSNHRGLGAGPARAGGAGGVGGALRDGGAALRFVGLAVGAIVLIVAGLAVAGVGDVGAVVARVPVSAVVVALVGSAGYLWLKGVALAWSVRAAGGRVTLVRSWRALVEGIAVEAVTWPGKVWADGYRAARLSDVRGAQGLARAALGVGLARAGALVSGGVFGALALGALGAEGMAKVEADSVGGADAEGVVIKIVLALGLAACLCTAVWGARRLRLLSAGVGWRRAGAAACASTVATGVDVVSVAWVCWLVCGADPVELWPQYVLVGMVASATGLPLGLGVIDAGLYVVLTQRLGVAGPSALAGVALCRALGPGLSVAVGASSLLARGVEGRERDCEDVRDGGFVGSVGGSEVRRPAA